MDFVSDSYIIFDSYVAMIQNDNLAYIDNLSNETNNNMFMHFE